VLLVKLEEEQLIFEKKVSTVSVKEKIKEQLVVEEEPRKTWRDDKKC
jgi:hypothetical protein